MLREKLQISREKFEFLYSIFILLVIPVLIAVNTLLLITGVRSNFDTELRRKADALNSLVGIAVRDELADKLATQSIIKQIQTERGEVRYIHILMATPDTSIYKVVASTNEQDINTQKKQVQYGVVMSEKRSVAQQTAVENGRATRVVSPVVDSTGTIVALVESEVSSQQADGLIGSTLLRSLVVMVVTIVVVILLLLNHFKFVEYALLFRKLKEVDQLKNDFLSVASHELKAPMTVIKGNIENIIDGIAGSVDDTAKASLKTMYDETERLNNLVNDLLNVSRIEQGHITYALEQIDVRDIIDQLIKSFNPKASAKELELTYERSPNPSLIMVDKGRFIEIMTNLIDNAIKYSRHGTVKVIHKDNDTQVKICVKDTGIGMGAEARGRLFTRFYRIQNATTKDIPGTGLGLWIVKQYIEKMNGSIEVDSIEGEGSEFSVIFPRSK